MKFSSRSLAIRFAMIITAGLMICGCASTMEGVGKDLQNMGTSMGGSSSNTNQQNQSQTKGKDVVITPVK